MRLVFLHAFPLDSRMWKCQLGILPGKTETPDLYGFGDSLESWASGVLDSVTGDDLIVVGASMGGSCALEMARQAEHRIAGLVLVGAKAGHHPEPELRDKYISALTRRGISGLWPAILDQCFGSEPDQQLIDHFKTISQEQRIEDLIRAVKVFHGRPDLTDVVRRWSKPLLAISGTKGQLESAEKAVALAADAAWGKAYVMRDCGHYMNMERADEFNKAIQDFLQTMQPQPRSFEAFSNVTKPFGKANSSGRRRSSAESPPEKSQQREP